MKKSSMPELISLTSKPRSGFMAILGKSTIDYLRAELGSDELRAVYIKSSPAHEGGTSIAIDLAFINSKIPDSRQLGDYKSRPNHRSVQFGEDSIDAGQRWGLVDTRVERLTPSYDGYDVLMKRNPTTAKMLAALTKVVALRFIVEYSKMPDPLAFDRVDAKSSRFVKVKPRAKEEATAVLSPEPIIAPLKVVLNSPPIIQKVVDGRVDLALAISVNGAIAREKMVQGLSATQLIEVIEFMETRFGTR